MKTIFEYKKSKDNRPLISLSLILPIAIGAVFTLITSCRKFVEIPPPQTELVTASVFNNPSSATSALTNIYVGMLTNGSSSAVVLDESGGMAYNTGLQSDELISYTSPKSLFYTNALTASKLSGYGPWPSAYNYIYQANAIIEGLQKYSGVGPAIKQQLTGEAKFIRAFWQFYLTNLYGDVPLVLTTNYAVNGLTIARTPRVQVLQQVVNDLLDAQQLLNVNYVDATDTATTTERVRPNKAVATALLARAYLYLGDYSKDASNYQKAETQATSVINNSTYRLSPLNGPNSVFKMNSSEAIWQLQTVLPTSNYATPDGQFFILIAAPTGTNTSISTELLNAFEPGDQRKVNWIGSYTTTSVPSMTYYFPFKYQDRQVSSASEYVMMLRLGEEYLIRAEARAEQSNTGGAFADLNTIRTRAGLPDYAVTTDKASLLAAILHERQVELFCEWGHRWLDLNRGVNTASTVNVNTVMNVVCPLKGGTWSSDGHQRLYPIPQGDIASDPNLTQNPGY